MLRQQKEKDAMATEAPRTGSPRRRNKELKCASRKTLGHGDRYRALHRVPKLRRGLQARGQVLWAFSAPGSSLWRRELPCGHRHYLPVNCNQCERPVCVSVCRSRPPTSADGVVVWTRTGCIGCQYCKAACPYGVRYLDQ